MKVVEINTVCGKSGSVGRITAELTTYAAERGAEAYAAYGRGKAFGIDENMGIPIGGKLSFFADVFKSRLFDGAGFNSASATKKLIKRLKEISPDVIHLHNAHGYYLNAPLFFNYLKEENIKLVWTLHDCWPFTGHCAYFENAECYRWKSGCYSCPMKGQYPKSFFDNSKRNYERKKEVFSSLDPKNVRLVVPSEWLKEKIGESFLKDYSVEVIPNGVDVSSFKYNGGAAAKNKPGLVGEKIVLGVTNVWDDRKGLPDFITLAEWLPLYRFIGVGSAEIKGVDMPKNMSWIYRTNDINELADYYSAADVFVNPTYDDNFPTTHMEAQCCGAAVVSYDAGGSKENIISPYGVTVKKGDVKELKDAVKKIARSGYDKDELSALARDKFDRTKCYGRYFELYNTLI